MHPKANEDRMAKVRSFGTSLISAGLEASALAEFLNISQSFDATEYYPIAGIILIHRCTSETSVPMADSARLWTTIVVTAERPCRDVEVDRVFSSWRIIIQHSTSSAQN